MPNTTLYLGKTFTDMASVRLALDNYSVELSLPYKFKTNKSNKLLAICPTNKTSACPFTISANKRIDDYIHIVKLINHNQNCPTLAETFKARGSYLVKFAAPLLEDIAALKPRDIVNRVHSEVGAEASYMVAWRSRAANKKRKAEEIDMGYQCIKSLLDHLLMANPGSLTSFEVDTENRFVHAFLCLLPWIKATKYCRPVFILDACYSKSSYNDINFCANIIGDSKLVLVAFAIGSVENSSNWA